MPDRDPRIDPNMQKSLYASSDPRIEREPDLTPGTKYRVGSTVYTIASRQGDKAVSYWTTIGQQHIGITRSTAVEFRALVKDAEKL